VVPDATGSGRTDREKQTMSRLRLLGFSGALVLAALLGGTVLSAVSAADPTTSSTPAAATPATGAGTTTVEPVTREVGEYCQTFRAAFAANLGKTEDQVVAAAKAAIGTTIDDALANGKLTRDQADRLKARVAAAPADGCGLLNGWRVKVAKAAVGVARDGLQAAASALHLSPAELRKELRAGTDLRAIAAAQGVPYDAVSAAIVAAVKADLDQAVANGSIRQERADRILERLRQRLADGTWRQRSDERPATPPGNGD
jgi:ribosomal protein S20